MALQNVTSVLTEALQTSWKSRREQNVFAVSVQCSLRLFIQKQELMKLGRLAISRIK